MQEIINQINQLMRDYLPNLIGALAILALALAGVNSGTYMVYGFIAAAMIVWQHRDNIQRIRDGKERRLGHPATKVE